MKNKPTLQINIAQAAKYLGVDRQKVVPMIARGDITGEYKPGKHHGQWLIDFNSVTKYNDNL